jgi:predicted dehydrogenase
MIQIAFVGVGHIHIPGFIAMLKKRTDVKVKSVWDHDGARAKKRADELGAAPVSDLAAIWADPEIAGVVICSETNQHEKLVLAGAKAKKHLFVEKPLGLGSQDAFRMAKAIEKAGVLFQTGYFSRGSPVSLFVREQIEKGSFGKITRARQFLGTCMLRAGVHPITAPNDTAGRFATRYQLRPHPPDTVRRY